MTLIKLYLNGIVTITTQLSRMFGSYREQILKLWISTAHPAREDGKVDEILAEDDLSWLKNI